MAAPTTIKLTKVTGGSSHTFAATCRRATLVAMGNDTATVRLGVGTDEILMKDGSPMVFEDRELGAPSLRTIAFGGTVSSVSVFEELGAGS